MQMLHNSQHTPTNNNPNVIPASLPPSFPPSLTSVTDTHCPILGNATAMVGENDLDPTLTLCPHLHVAKARPALPFLLIFHSCRFAMACGLSWDCANQIMLAVIAVPPFTCIAFCDTGVYVSYLHTGHEADHCMMVRYFRTVFNSIICNMC